MTEAPHLSCKIPGIPIYTVYAYPTDWPDNFVVRLFINNQPTDALLVCDNLEQVDRVLLGYGLYRRPRLIGDQNQILETWHLPEWAYVTVLVEGKEEATRQFAYRRLDPPRPVSLVDSYNGELDCLFCEHCGWISDVVTPGIPGSHVCPDCYAMQELGWL